MYVHTSLAQKSQHNFRDVPSPSIRLVIFSHKHAVLCDYYSEEEKDRTSTYYKISHQGMAMVVIMVHHVTIVLRDGFEPRLSFKASLSSSLLNEKITP
ncbi:unnamed protein product [Cylicocyclus nassatus]|uniref:Uncharacterized protein n=1 Tax=Cylicocyclus nassatus TaxID=53992 RepID=A0AA36GJJ5_CYLNA|nr:unnamed protein product [Cylicocyclus nassatus]